jgi:hypothetical protein
MNMNKTLIAMAAALALSTCAYADLIVYQATFDTDATGGAAGGAVTAGLATWSSTYQAVQATDTASGWNIGGNGPRWEFSWPSQSVMQNAALYSEARVSADIIINDDSWLWMNTPGTYHEVGFVGNSDGSASWTQNLVAIPAPYGTGTVHVDKTFAQMGWQPGDTWFQIFLGQNSDANGSIQFFVDNITVTIPEPSTFALAGLGAAAMLIFRRRN